MNTENSKTNELTNLDYLYQINLILKTQTTISALTWNDTFDLPDGSYSIEDIQDYFEFIINKHETLTEICSCINISIKLKTESFVK